PFNAMTLIFAPIPISIYFLSLVAGVALWRDNSFGRKASIVVQAIQLPKIVSPLIIFTFSFGFDLWVHILLTRGFSSLGFEFKFLAFNQFFFNVQDAPFGLGVSIIACISLAMLLRACTQTKPPFLVCRQAHGVLKYALHSSIPLSYKKPGKAQNSCS